MYAFCCRLENSKNIPEKNFAVLCSVLERKWANSCLCSCAFRSVSPWLSFFVVLSEDENFSDKIVSSIQSFVNGLLVVPNYQLVITKSPTIQ